MKKPKFALSQFVFANNYRRRILDSNGEWCDGEWEEAFIEEAEYSLKYQSWTYIVQLRRKSANGTTLRLHLGERELCLPLKSSNPNPNATS